MSQSFASALRRANRLMRPAKMKTSSQSLQKAMTGFIVTSALAPFAAITPKTAKPRKAAAPKSNRTLGVVLKQLRQAQALMPGATSAAGREVSPRIPGGAQYLARTHRSTAGSCGYKLYLPASQPKHPKGLILMLHGCNQTPDDFAVGTHMNALAEKHGIVVAYPAQTPRGNRASCWNWFQPAHQVRGAGEPAILASLTRKLMKEFGLDRDAVFVAGLSAGGAMATILADVYPDVFSAAGVHSGLARGAAHNALTALMAMRSGGASEVSASRVVTRARPVRWIIFQGAADRTVHPSNAAQIVLAATSDDAVPTRISNRSAGGRDYARVEYVGSDGATLVESWMIENSGHAWSGGRAKGSYTDTKGPDASAHMIRFFLTKSD